MSLDALKGPTLNKINDPNQIDFLANGLHALGALRTEKTPPLKTPKAPESRLLLSGSKPRPSLLIMAYKQ